MSKSNTPNNKEYFFCYTKILSDYLRTKGFSPITVAMEPKTKQIFSLYKVDDALSKELSAYSKNK